jgi:hypothetical protein
MPSSVVAHDSIINERTKRYFMPKILSIIDQYGLGKIEL